MVTQRVRIGHMVICTGFRNPALTAKLASTIDVISGGRFELGIGAGWKDDEWHAYGYGFPSTNERLGRLGDDLEVITRMLAPGHATYEGEYARVKDAINVPKGVQEHIPVIVGGNGPNVTMRLAARFADELNLVYRPPDEVPGLIATARQRCEEIDRDPATLRLSMYVADDEVEVPGQRRVDVLGRLGGFGLDRLVAFPTRYGATREVQEQFAEDCRAAGLLSEAREAAAIG
jgi:alkanesulfonate monooxygenase SsuD/methylene tetrahydromethanopterin reductase-like flavin-dependent oxidoreductase (luciferase family)